MVPIFVSGCTAAPVSATMPLLCAEVEPAEAVSVWPLAISLRASVAF